MAGKTGTSQNYENAWFVGYTPQLATAVWMGSPVGNVSMGNVTGGSFPAAIFGAFMRGALEGAPVEAFEPPDPKALGGGGFISDPPQARGRIGVCGPRDEARRRTLRARLPPHRTDPTAPLPSAPAPTTPGLRLRRRDHHYPSSASDDNRRRGRRWRRWRWRRGDHDHQSERRDQHDPAERAGDDHDDPKPDERGRASVLPELCEWLNSSSC